MGLSVVRFWLWLSLNMFEDSLSDGIARGQNEVNRESCNQVNNKQNNVNASDLRFRANRESSPCRS